VPNISLPGFDWSVLLPPPPNTGCDDLSGRFPLLACSACPDSLPAFTNISLECWFGELPLPIKAKPPDLPLLDADELLNVNRLCCAFCVTLSDCGCEFPSIPPGKPPELGPFTVFVLLNVNTGGVIKFSDADLLVEAGVEVITALVVDMEVTAEVAALASVLEAAIFTAGLKPPTVDDATFSFTFFEKSNLKPPGEEVIVLLVIAFN